MPVSNRSLRVFLEGFAARDLAEPLVSVDLRAGPEEALALMARRDFDALGVRQEGLVAGFVERADLAGGKGPLCARPFDPATVVSDAAPLNDVVHGLARSQRLFVTALGAVAGIITVPDLQKPPMRMWLFGIVTIVEMRTTQLIRAHCREESWKEYVSEGRLKKAEELLEERRRRGQDPRLLDCLQFADKGQVVARNEAIRKLTRFTSRRQVEEAVKAMESLRNNLAHSQDIVTSDWEIIVTLAENLERVVVQPAQGGYRPAESGE